MAREPGPRTTPETFSRMPVEDEDSDGRKISSTMAAVLIIISIILDVASVFEIPIADVVSPIINIVLLYVGISQTRWLIGQGLELIPVVDFLPLYTIGIIAVIMADRSGVAKVVEKVPVPSGKKALARGAARGAATRQSSRLARNQVFGKAAEASSKRAEAVLKKLPGPLRSRPGGEEHTPEGVPLPAGRQGAVSRLRRAASRGREALAPAGSSQEGDLPFPDTYYRYERELLPELSDITADIDVTGEKATEEAARIRAGGPSAQKKVQ